MTVLNDNKDDLVGRIMKRLIDSKSKNESNITLDIWGTGKKYIRQYIYIDDLVDALIYVMKNYSDSLPINIATDEAISLDDIVQAIKNEIEYKGNIKYQSDKLERSSQRLLSIERLNKLGWKPKVTLSEGIKKLHKSYSKSQ